jgi:hypothetical protein
MSCDPATTMMAILPSDGAAPPEEALPPDQLGRSVGGT